MKGIFEEYPFESLLLGFFACWLFVINRQKPRTIKQKVRDVVKSGSLGLPPDFKSTTLEMMLKGMAKFAGDFATEKRPIHLPLLVYILSIIPMQLRMGLQFGLSMVLACFTCLRQGEYSVTNNTAPNKSKDRLTYFY